MDTHKVTLLHLPPRYRKPHDTDVNSDLGALHHVNVHTVADVTDVYIGSIFRVK